MRIYPHPRMLTVVPAAALTIAVMFGPAAATNALTSTGNTAAPSEAPSGLAAATPAAVPSTAPNTPPAGPETQAPQTPVPGPEDGTPGPEDEPAVQTPPTVDGDEDGFSFTVGADGITVAADGEERPADSIILGTASAQFDALLTAAPGTTDQPYAVELADAAMRDIPTAETPQDGTRPATLTITAGRTADPQPAQERLAHYSLIAPDAGTAFDLDHEIPTRWELAGGPEPVANTNGTAPAANAVYCVTVTTTGLSESANALPQLHPVTTTLTFVAGEGWQDLDPAHLSLCSSENDTPGADTPGAEAGPNPAVPDDAAMTVVTDREPTTVIKDPNNPLKPAENYYTAKTGTPLAALGFAYTGTRDYQQAAFRLIAGPEDGTATYRNSTPDGILADNPATVRTLAAGRTSAPVHRAVTTRDLFGQWEFSQRGVYCVGYASRGINSSQTQVPQEVIDYAGILKFAVGGADPASVDCAYEASRQDSMIEFPAYPRGSADPTPAPDSSPEPGDTASAAPSASATAEPDDGATADPTSTPQVTDAATDGAIDQADDGATAAPTSTAGADDAAGATPTPTATADPNIRTLRGPASAAFCPADAKGAQQARAGTYVMTFGDGIGVARDDGKRTIESGSTIVIDQSATRDAAAGIPDFVPTQSHYWATGGSNGNAASFVWNTEDQDEDVELSLTQKEGPGKVLIFGAETDGPGVADGGAGTLAAGSTGNLIFGFNSPGEYTLTLTVSGADYTLNFAVGDQNPTSTSPLTSTLLAACADASVTANLMDPEASGSEPDANAGVHAGLQDSASGNATLGDEWWAIAIAGLVLAGILIAFIIGTVVNSRKGY